jgi:hypothetical protein
MARWEYGTLDFTKPKQDFDELNRLGADGWEAVAMVTTWGVSEMRRAHPVILVKRPLGGEAGEVATPAA